MGHLPPPSKLSLGPLLYVSIWVDKYAVESATFTYLSKIFLLLSCAPVAGTLSCALFLPAAPDSRGLALPFWTLPHWRRHTHPHTQAVWLLSSPTEGALELHTHHLIPSLRQVVFQGDRLPFQCSASYLGNDTRIRWYHNRAPVEGDEQAGILLAESLIHDCTFITRYSPHCPFSARAEGGHSTHFPAPKRAVPIHIPGSVPSV